MYLRSGGDVFTLQSLLGYGSLDIVCYYARIAEVDIEQAHRKASLADNWRLSQGEVHRINFSAVKTKARLRFSLPRLPK